MGSVQPTPKPISFVTSHFLSLLRKASTTPVQLPSLLLLSENSKPRTRSHQTPNHTRHKALPASSQTPQWPIIALQLASETLPPTPSAPQPLPSHLLLPYILRHRHQNHMPLWPAPPTDL